MKANAGSRFYLGVLVRRSRNRPPGRCVREAETRREAERKRQEEREKEAV